jgi:hypothetical protein
LTLEEITMATTFRRLRRSAITVSQAVSPREFCQSLWNQRRGFIEDRTRRGLEDIQLGILLIFFANQDPSAEAFEAQLRTLIGDDSRERRALIRTAARRILRSWSSSKWTRDADGRLVMIESHQSQDSTKRISA